MLYSSINGSEYQGTIFHKVNSRLESAVALSWTSGSHETRFAVGAKYNPDKDSTIRVSTPYILLISFFLTTAEMLSLAMCNFQWMLYFLASVESLV